MAETRPPQLARRQKVEQIFALAYLERDLYHRDQELKVHWPTDLGLAAEITLRLQTPSGRIYVEAQPFAVRPGAVANLGKVVQVPDGDYQVVLLPRLEEYYEHGLKIERRIDIQIANGPYSTALYGTEEQRRQEALDDAARRNLHLFSEIAKMTLDRWAQVKPAVIQQAITAVNQRTADSALYRLGLLGMAARFGNDPHFPADLLPQLAAAILTGDEGPEGIVNHAAEVLAGQLYPDQIFAHSGQTGAWQQAQGEAKTLAWLQQRARAGFPAWDLNTEIEPIVLALTHLADWALHDQIAELAAVLLDKLFFTLAVNSAHGVFGFAGKTARTAATTSLSRLLWGLGAWNNRIISTVALAGSGYALPPIIAQIAADQPEILVSRERHLGSEEVNQITYKTPHTLLCSVQDYRPGEPGGPELVWQATLGPDAVVFAQDSGGRPRVAQWQDVLLVIYKLPAADNTSCTRVYFPTAAFAEYTLHDGWAFARLDNGYLALRTSGEMQLVTSGESAGRELRVAGAAQSWLLHLGRAAQDGSFAEFQAKVVALAVTIEPLALHAPTLRGETIVFGWSEPLRVNGVVQSIRGFQHYDNPYCVAEVGAEQLEIRFGDEVMRLDFANSPEIQ